MLVPVRLDHYGEAVREPADREARNSDAQCSNQRQLSLQQPDGVVLDALFDRPFGDHGQNFFGPSFDEPVKNVFFYFIQVKELLEKFKMLKKVFSLCWFITLDSVFIYKKFSHGFYKRFIRKIVAEGLN